MQDGAACRVLPGLLGLLLLGLPLRGLWQSFGGQAVKGTLVPPPRHKWRRQPGQTSQSRRVRPAMWRAGRELESVVCGTRAIPPPRQGPSPSPTTMRSHGGQSSQRSRKGNLPTELSLRLDRTQPSWVPALHLLVRDGVRAGPPHGCIHSLHSPSLGQVGMEELSRK